MTYKEKDLETVIIQKLGDMEDLLNSFMSSLKEPPQKKGKGAVPVPAPARGKVSHWQRTGGWVGRGDLICLFTSKRFFGLLEYTEPVDSPANGWLSVVTLDTKTEFSRGEPIAYVDPDEVSI